jgi:RNA polymerase sigma-70 factor (ECF subfamily)
MPHRDDDAIHRALTAGDPAAFAAAYDRFGPRMYRAARALLRCDADAQDAVQDVFLALVRGRAGLAGVVDVEAYVFTALYRAAQRIASARATELSRLRRVSEMTAMTAQPVAPPDAEPVRRALAGLPAEQREVVAMKVDAGLTFARIGVVLGVSPHTAASRYRYALEKLRAALAKEVRP